jgi:hypothetical protein
VEPEKQPLLANGSEQTFVSGQRLNKQFSMATNTHATIELLLEMWCFICGPCRDVITRIVGAMSSESYTRVEAGSNTSTIALRIVGGDEKGSLKSETVKYGRKSQKTRTEKDCAGKGQRYIQNTDPSSR